MGKIPLVDAITAGFGVPSVRATRGERAQVRAAQKFGWQHGGYKVRAVQPGEGRFQGLGGVGIYGRQASLHG